MRLINRILSLLIGVSFIAYLNSCKVGPDFSKPQPTTNASFRYDSIKSDTVVNLRWWEIFDNSELDSLIYIGLQENKDVLTAASRVQQAMITVGFTRVDIYPQIGINANANFGNVIGNNPLQTESGIYLGGLTMNWEIDFWGKFRRATEAARANYVASEYAKRTVQLGVITAITSAYFDLLRYRESLEIAQSTLALRQRAVDIIGARFEQGIVPAIDLNQAKIQLAIAKSSVPFYERRIAITETTLAVLLGRNPFPVITQTQLLDQDYPAPIPAGIPSTLLERRPDIIAAENKYHAATANVGVAQAQRFPSISLTGLAGGLVTDDLAGLATGSFAWSASAGLLSPLLNWGKNKKRAEIQKEVALQAAYAYENTVIQAFKEVEDALVTIETLRHEVEASQEQMEAAVAARDLSRDRYDGGVTSYLEVIENDRAAFDAELKFVEVRQSLLNSYILLYKALGGGWITPEEEQQANNSETQD